MLSEFDWSRTMSASPIFLVLIGCSIVTFGALIERTIYFWKRRSNPDETLRQCLQSIGRRDLQQASWVCQSTPHPMGAVARQLFRPGPLTGGTVEEKLQIALSEQKMLLEKNLPIMGTMAAVAPLIGLLGTVVGIMRAFHDMAKIGSAAPSVVAAGVAEALVTTAAGLVIAVPAVMLYNHFARRAGSMLTIAENHARTLRTALIDSGIEEIREEDASGGPGSGSSIAPAKSSATRKPAGSPSTSAQPVS